MWSSALSEVDLSHNCLSSMPINICASNLISLNLSTNQFNHVPLCICTFTTLISLDISGNHNIKSLPCEMGMLTKLEQLNITGLKKLREPPKSFISSSQDCISYLKRKFSDSTSSLKSIQLMIVGNSGVGKRTFASRVHGRDLHQNCVTKVCVSEWDCHRSFKNCIHFRVWIFKSLEDYKATHHCFLSQCSLYLLLFNLKDGSKGLSELKPWLKAISHHALYPGLMVVGTHLDEMSQQEIHDATATSLLQQAEVIVASYDNRLERMGFFTVGLGHYTGSVSKILDAIYSNALKYPFLERGMVNAS